jgi:hypothetical protein
MTLTYVGSLVKKDINSFLSPNLAMQSTLYSSPQTSTIYSTLPSSPSTPSHSTTITTTHPICRHPNPRRNLKRAEGHEQSRSGPNTRRTKFAATAKSLSWMWIVYASRLVKCAESITGESVGARSRSRLSASRRRRLMGV